MDAKRRKIQLELAFMAEGRGEAPMAADKGTEVPKANCTPEDPALPKTVGSVHGPWRISRSPALSYVFPNAHFNSLGLALLAEQGTA